MGIPKPYISPATWPVRGHEWAVEYLQRVVASNRAAGSAGARGLRHAYLFVGPPQVGKTTLVRAFAQALLCTAAGDSDAPIPCGECRNCRLMSKGQHPDFLVIPPTDKDGLADRVNGTLRVEQSADLIHQASLRPLEGRYKVFLIQDAQMAHASFSHKILKTLEEPPAHVVLCVTATDRSELLPTIVSRCEVLELRPIPVATVRNALVDRWKLEEQRAELLARLCGGRLGWAVRQMENEDGASRRLQMLAQLQHLVRANRVERLRFAEEISTQRDDQGLFNMLELWVTWWRDVLLTQHGCSDAISNLDQQQEVQQYAGTLQAVDVERHLDTLQRVERYLHHTVNTRLAMDTLLLDVPRPVA